jgi:hypothetical protein
MDFHGLIQMVPQKLGPQILVPELRRILHRLALNLSLLPMQHKTGTMVLAQKVQTPSEAMDKGFGDMSNFFK